MSKEPQPQIQAPARTSAAERSAQKREKRRTKSDAEEVLGVRFLTRIDPDEDFSDVDGDPRNEFALDGEESDRHYHYASQDDIAEYKGGVVPYRVEYAGKDGVRVMQGVGDIKDGEPIVKKGLILVSCDKAKWQKRNRFEYVKTLKHNEAQMKRRQRDVDLRDREAFQEEFSEVRG